jgi:regulator of protease activity HflC (stomatin/prohibitin superfamily)
MNFLSAFLITFFGMFIALPILAALTRMFGVYAIVEEGKCHVYVLFGKVVAVLTEPGLYFLWIKMGLPALFVNWLGRRHVLDMRLDQQYLRSQAVNSEEGAPMGIGIWYEF